MTWQPRQPIERTICSPACALPRGGDATAGVYVSLFANRYATAALISASLRGWSAGALLFELYQTFGIQVTLLMAYGSRTQFFTQSSVSLPLTLVKIGPGLRRFSKPFVLWHP